MYAIIRTGGKQYKVQAGDLVQVNKVDQKLGAEFVIDDILLVGGESTHVGQPVVKNAKVTVVVTKQARTRKLIVFKKKRRHSYRKFKTHRQEYTELFVKAITSPDGKVAKTDAAPKVVDMKAKFAERIASKVAARKARVSGGAALAETLKAETKKTVKKVAKKTAAKKPAAKKKTATKKVAKKAAK